MTASGSRWPMTAVKVGETSVAYHQSGTGSPVLFLHGCPFSSFVWRNVVPALNADRRCIAPDLLGLSDTESPSGSDWSLRAQAEMVIGFLDALDLPVVDIVGHDHGGAVSQILAAEHPERIRRLVLMNAEAYDNWPSREGAAFHSPHATAPPRPGDALALRPPARHSYGARRRPRRRRPRCAGS